MLNIWQLFLSPYQDKQEIEENYQDTKIEENVPVIRKNDSKEISLVTIRDLMKEIHKNISAKNAPGYYAVTGQVPKGLPKENYI